MFSMVECYLEMGQIGQDYGLKQYLMDKIELDHVTQVIGYHPSYLEHFLKTQNFVMRGDGPLPYHYRHYLAIMAAARHQCTYLINLHEQEYIRQGGDPTWLNGLEFIPAKLRAIYDINKLLAHRPWLLSKEHIERLTKGKHSWSMAEVVHAIVLLAHFHSLSSFVFSCGLTQELNMTTDGSGSCGTEGMPILIPQQGTATQGTPTTTTETTESSQIFNSNIPQHITKTICDVNDDEEEEDTSSESEEVSVDDLMARMKVLSEKPNECNEVELSNRFKNVEQQAASLPAAVVEQPVIVPQTISHYVEDPDFTYQDFARRGAETMTTTFRIQDYSWDDHGYSLVNRLYNDVGTLLDVKFRAAYNLTYFTMAGRKNVDTSKFRRAIWNYIQCIYGIRHDDYDYGEVNQLLDKSLKMFIKTACCFPERITKQDYDSILCELLHSEKVHVNLMILEARNQAELLYALREIMRYMT